jgi:L-threonylcarbamoyladenylate synthase
VYGIGAVAHHPTAVAKIFALKRRPTSNPLIVHVAAATQIPGVAGDWPTAAAALAERFWPGPLTLVVPKSAQLPPMATAHGSTVAVRWPSHLVAQALITAAGPLAAPSANRSGHLSPTTAEHVLASLPEGIDLVLDGGPCPGGLESTVVDVSGPTVRLLRPGLITPTQIEQVVGPVEIGPSQPASGAPLPSPGLLARHYAPHTALECVATPEEANFLADLYETAGLKVVRYIVGTDPVAVAANLYADLHALDSGAFDRIIVPLPPDTDEWQAVRDRLTRASAQD